MHHTLPIIGHTEGQTAPGDRVVVGALLPNDLVVDRDILVPVRPVLLVGEAEDVDELVHDGAVVEAHGADVDGLGGAADAAHVGGAAAGADELDAHFELVGVRGGPEKAI